MTNKNIKTQNNIKTLNIESQGLRVRVQHLRHLQHPVKNVYTPRMDASLIKVPYDNLVTVTPAMYDKTSQNEFIKANASTTVCPFGGLTTVHITYKNEKLIATGESHCHFDETFDRSLGYSIALGRAMKEGNLEIK